MNEETNLKACVLMVVIILSAFVAQDGVNADVFEIPLACEGYYITEQTWTVDFDLGTTLTEISDIYIDWSGSIRAEFAEDLVTGDRFPMDAQFVAKLYDSVNHDFCGSASLQTGAATYPNPEPFDLKSTFSNEGWSMLLNGQGTIEVGFWGVIRPMTIITIEDPNGELNSATLVIEAILPEPRTITVGLGAGYDFNTIQAAIDDAYDGDTIIVADGIYTGEGNRDIDFLGKAITLRSANGPGNCIIDCNGTGIENYNSHRGFRFVSGEYANSVISGFTIINGYAPYEVHVPPLGVGEYLGGAIYCWRSSPTISNCIIKGNTGGYGGYGGGIVCFASNPTVSNCILIGNQAYEGGGMSILFGSDPTIINCTFSGNVAYNVGGGIHNGNVIGSLENYPKLSNCILWGNSPDEINSSYGTPVITYSNVEGGWSGEGNIDVDPCFIEPGHWEDPCNTPTMPWDDIWVNGDYHLKSQAGRWEPESESWVQDAVTSPCIDRGNPNNPVGVEPFPNGGRINMGAYGGTVEASKSYFGKPVCETIVAGDVNGDCIVNYKDFALMALHWLRDEN